LRKRKRGGRKALVENGIKWEQRALSIKEKRNYSGSKSKKREKAEEGKGGLPKGGARTGTEFDLRRKIKGSPSHPGAHSEGEGNHRGLQ